MYSQIRIENLERCIRNNEAAPDFDLSTFHSRCGTYGCLVGNDMIAVDANWKATHPRTWAAREYGLLDRGYRDHPFAFLFYFCRREMGSSRDKEKCLHRLRVAVAYWKRKQAIWHEADGRVKESARHTEGDLNILRAVLDEVAQQELVAAV